MSDVVEKLREVSVKRLRHMLEEALTKGEKDVVDQIGGFLTLSQNRDQILESFAINMNNYFDELMGKDTQKPEPVYNFETLSLVQDEDLEIMVALEGMINAARNACLPSFISFNTRLNSLFDRQQVDEGSNPLDPSQVAHAFKDAILPLGLDAQNSLAIYRRLNNEILKRIDEVLTEANHLLIELGVIPNLGMDSGSRRRQEQAARARPRSHDTNMSFGSIEEDPYDPSDDNPELFSMMQNLLHPGDAQANPTARSGEAGAGRGAPEGGSGAFPLDETVGNLLDETEYAIPTSMMEAGRAAGAGPMQPFVPQSGEQVQMVDQAQLMSILSNIQKVLEEKTAGKTEIPKAMDEVEQLDISSQLGEMLKDSQEEGFVNAVDRQSSDIINLVTLLYEAIWKDESVPIPIKELIGRTQITIIKVALSDTTFFNKENHPARMVLNEFASAGIGWTEVEELEEDPLYKKIEELVNKVLLEYMGEVEFFEEIVKDFRAFRAREAAKTRVLEQRILRAKERQERVEDIHELVTQKIGERILGRDLHEFITDLLENPFHKFMVKLVLKEGPGSNAWKQAINTIDVLLWTVQPHDHSGDRKRLDTVNPRLLNNLRKAFRIAQVPTDEIDDLLSRLQEVQLESFAAPEPEEADPEPEEELRFDDNTGLDDDEEEGDHDPLELDLERAQRSSDRKTTEEVAASKPKAEPKPAVVEEDEEETLGDDDREVQMVDQLSVGIWVEFIGEDDQNIRCKLAAKINAIDKLIFVNRQGVKVVEKTRMGFAQELKDKTVKIISDGLLFSRALESVIGNLRDAQQVQHTGSAYQPASEETGTA